MGGKVPGLSEPVTPDDYQEALLQAETVLFWAEQIIRH